MLYYSNGSFNWYDVYYMPIKLREFYWRELLNAKNEEKQEIEKVKTNTNSKIRRR